MEGDIYGKARSKKLNQNTLGTSNYRGVWGVEGQPIKKFSGKKAQSIEKRECRGLEKIKARPNSKLPSRKPGRKSGVQEVKPPGTKSISIGVNGLPRTAKPRSCTVNRHDDLTLPGLLWGATSRGACMVAKVGESDPDAAQMPKKKVGCGPNVCVRTFKVSFYYIKLENVIIWKTKKGGTATGEGTPLGLMAPLNRQTLGAKLVMPGTVQEWTDGYRRVNWESDITRCTGGKGKTKPLGTPGPEGGGHCSNAAAPSSLGKGIVQEQQVSDRRE